MWHLSVIQMIPPEYIVSHRDGEIVRLTSPTGWWVEFATHKDMEELWELMRDYLDKPKPQ